MLSFPDSYLLRGLLTLVAISLMVPGIFGVDPPRWFDHGTPEPIKQQVPAGKTDPRSTLIGQSAISVFDADAQDQTELKAMVDGAGTSGQMTETSELVEAPAAGPQVDGPDPAKPVPLPLLADQQFSADRIEQPAVRARRDQSEAQLASASPKIAKTKPSQPRRPLLVARVFVKRIPADHLDLATPAQKESFIKITLPLILAANEEIGMRRAAIKRAASANDRGALEKWAQLYRIDVGKQSTRDLRDDILLRADAIPVSLALAQAAVESGWGTSRFAVQGNALFGQWAWKESAGLKPLQASNDRAVVRSFPNLFGSVRAYMHNLNTHSSYSDLRRQRARLADRDERGKGYALAGNLDRYAEIGMEYVDKLRTIIRVNDLDKYATAKLQ
jgi:Bax protein